MLFGTDPLAENTLARFDAGVESQSLTALFANTPSILMSQRAADLLSLSVGNVVELNMPGRSAAATVPALFKGPNPAATESLLLTDIAIAQNLLDRIGLLTRIDLVLTPEQVQLVSEWLPDGVKLVESETRNSQLLEMSAAFISILRP